MNIVILDSKHWPDVQSRGVSKQEVAEVVEAAAHAARKLLLALPEYVNLVVYPTVADEVIPETGGSGMTYTDEYVSVFFDHTLPYGKEKLLDELRTTTFHELVHAVTFHHEPWQPSVLFGAVTEGLATVFERDYADSQPLWGSYEDDVTMQAWLDELRELPVMKDKNMEYTILHPDGRKWIAYKTGTWVIDKLCESGEDLFELMKLGHKDVLAKFEAL